VLTIHCIQYESHTDAMCAYHTSQRRKRNVNLL